MSAFFAGYPTGLNPLSPKGWFSLATESESESKEESKECYDLVKIYGGPEGSHMQIKNVAAN